MKQDRNGVRTAQDLERKYDLSSLFGLKQAVELQEEGINKTNATLEQFSNVVLEMSTKVEEAIHSVDVMYALGDSETTAPTSGWDTEAPTWQNNKYMWQKTVITYVDGRTDESSPTCISGAKGSPGSPGAAGTDGKGVKQIINYYLANNVESGVTTTTSGWTEAIQSVSSTNKYLWNYEKITYTDNSITTTQPCIIGAYGNAGPQGPQGEKGDDGTGVTILGSYETEAALRAAHPTGNTGDAYLVEGNLYVWCIEDNDWRNVGNIKGPQGEQGPEGPQGTEGPQGDTGVGIESISEHYAVSDSNSTEPTTWDLTPPNMTPENKYLWNYETIFYTNGTSANTVKRVIGVYGDTGENGEIGPQGDTGIGVDDVLEQYYLSSSNTEQIGGEWTEQQEAWQEGKYIWTRSKITWTDNTISYTTPVLASAINGANENINEVSKKVDTKISTWYYSGEPTLSNTPAKDWTNNNLKSEHIGDLYYDKETGYAYIFSFENSVYSWKQVQDKDTVEALAIANAATDTADSKRRVFLDTPEPPYDNGDLWLNNEEIYVCQIGKPEGELYADGDFIIGVKYTDDTLANEVANELTIVKGQVTTIIEDNNEIKITFTETTNLVNDLTNEVADEIATRSAMIRATSENGLPVIELGSTESPVQTKYKNDGMYIEENGATTSYFKNGKAYNYDMEVLHALTIGRFAFKPRKNGNLSLVYIGERGDE